MNGLTRMWASWRMWRNQLRALRLKARADEALARANRYAVLAKEQQGATEEGRDVRQL